MFVSCVASIKRVLCCILVTVCFVTITACVFYMFRVGAFV